MLTPLQVEAITQAGLAPEPPAVSGHTGRPTHVVLRPAGTMSVAWHRDGENRWTVLEVGAWVTHGLHAHFQPWGGTAFGLVDVEAGQLAGVWPTVIDLAELAELLDAERERIDRLRANLAPRVDAPQAEV